MEFATYPLGGTANTWKKDKLQILFVKHSEHLAWFSLHSIHNKYIFPSLWVLKSQNLKTIKLLTFKII